MNINRLSLPEGAAALVIVGDDGSLVALLKSETGVVPLHALPKPDDDEMQHMRQLRALAAPVEALRAASSEVYETSKVKLQEFREAKGGAHGP